MAIPEGKGADKPASKPEPQFYKLGGLPWKASDEEQLAQAAGLGGQVISREEAQAGQAARDNLDYVDQNWGAAGKAGMGVVSGLSLGLAPGLMAQAGMVDPGHVQAAQTSPLYSMGDVAGTMLPAILSGGESVGARGALGSALRMSPAGLLEMAGSGTERVLGGVLGESAGVLGRLGSAPLRMAARGATEGALINLGHTVGDNLIQNKPLSAEALAASGIDGALFGGLIGGTLGTVGSLGSMAVDSLGKLPQKLIGTGARAEGLVAKSLGVEADTLTEAANSPGGRKGFLREVNDTLKEHGGGVGESPLINQKAAKSALEASNAIRNDVLTELDKSAVVGTPSLERVFARVDAEVLAPKLGTSLGTKYFSAVEKIKAELSTVQPRAGIEAVEVAPKPAVMGERVGYHEPKPGKPGKYGPHQYEVSPAQDGYKIPAVDWEVPGSWSKWVESRDAMAKSLQGNPIRSEVLTILDSEIRTAMEHATKVNPGLEGLSEKFAAASTRVKIAEEMEKVLGAKVTNDLYSSPTAITAPEVGAFGGMLAMGHPAAGVGYLASKGISRMAGQRIGDAMARMAYDSSIGASAAEATMNVKSSIGSSLRSFFKTTTSVPDKATKVVRSEYVSGSRGYDRKAVEDSASRTEQLLSQNHQDRVRRYAENLASQGYEQYAAALMGVNARAVQYMLYNTPARAATKAMGSLRRQPAPVVPTMKEYKYMRISQAVSNPFSLLEDLNSGSLSRDAVQAVKYVYPEIHNEIVAEATNQIYEMKVAGKFMPMDKIASLGVALDATIDPTLEPEFIGAVQVALNQPPPGQEQQGPQGPPPMALTAQDTGLMTPFQQTMSV